MIGTKGLPFSLTVDTLLMRKDCHQSTNIRMGPRDVPVVSCESNTNFSQLSQLLVEEEITHESVDHIALRDRGSQASHIWRERVTQWCYDVVDHLHGSRSTVYVAMNILDRFLLQFPFCTTDRSYEAAALTALFLAVSICDSRNLEVVDLVRMSRLGVTIREIVKIGRDMTRGLSFNRRLLTPMHFVSELVLNLPASLDQERITDITNTARLHTELCTVDSFFSGIKASDVAFAAVLAALDSNSAEFFNKISSAPGSSFDKNRVSLLCDRIKKLRRATPNIEEPHIIPDSTDGDVNNSASFPSSNLRVVSCEKLSLRRSKGNAHLVRLDANSLPQFTQKRPVSPVTSIESKRQRIV